MSFEAALAEIKKGRGMRLPNWTPEAAVRVQIPDENSKMSEPYLYMCNRFGRVPWIPAYPDMFNRTWEVTD